MEGSGWSRKKRRKKGGENGKIGVKSSSDQNGDITNRFGTGNNPQGGVQVSRFEYPRHLFINFGIKVVRKMREERERGAPNAGVKAKGMGWALVNRLDCVNHAPCWGQVSRFAYPRALFINLGIKVVRSMREEKGAPSAGVKAKGMGWSLACCVGVPLHVGEVRDASRGPLRTWHAKQPYLGLTDNRQMTSPQEQMTFPLFVSLSEKQKKLEIPVREISDCGRKVSDNQMSGGVSGEKSKAALSGDEDVSGGEESGGSSLHGHGVDTPIATSTPFIDLSAVLKDDFRVFSNTSLPCSSDALAPSLIDSCNVSVLPLPVSALIDSSSCLFTPFDSFPCFVSPSNSPSPTINTTPLTLKQLSKNIKRDSHVVGMIMDSYSWLSLNVASIWSKPEHVRGVLLTAKPDLAALSEVNVKLHGQLPPMEGYQYLSCLRKKGGGGAALLVKEGIQVQRLDIAKHSAYEAVWALIGEGDRKFVFVSAYIPPKKEEDASDFIFADISNHLDSLLLMGLTVVIHGDLNAHIGRGSSGFRNNPVHEIHGHGDNLLALVQGKHGVIWNKHPETEGLITRVPIGGQKGRPGVLDYAICFGHALNYKSMNIDSKGVKWSRSDHRLLEGRFTISGVSKSKTRGSKRKCWRTPLSWAHFRQATNSQADHMRRCGFEQLSVEGMYTSFTANLELAGDEAV